VFAKTAKVEVRLLRVEDIEADDALEGGCVTRSPVGRA
jgi:hypothetical protein